MTPGDKRLCHKWAMAAHKGGKCVACGGKVTHGGIEDFHFDHKQQVNNHADKSDRWGGAIRDWPPFTERWFAWAATVDLICRECHERKHRTNGRSLFDALAIGEAQRRLQHFDAGPMPTNQLLLFE